MERHLPERAPGTTGSLPLRDEDFGGQDALRVRVGKGQSGIGMIDPREGTAERPRADFRQRQGAHAPTTARRDVAKAAKDQSPRCPVVVTGHDVDILVGTIFGAARAESGDYLPAAQAFHVWERTEP